MYNPRWIRKQIPLTEFGSVWAGVSAFATGERPFVYFHQENGVSMLTFPSNKPVVPCLDEFLRQSYQQYIHGKDGAFQWNYGHVEDFPLLDNREITIQCLDRTMPVFSLQIQDTKVNNDLPSKKLADWLGIPRCITGCEIVIPPVIVINEFFDGGITPQTWTGYTFDMKVILDALAAYIPKRLMTAGQAIAHLRESQNPVEIAELAYNTTVVAEPKGGHRWSQQDNLGIMATEVRRFRYLPFTKTVEPVLVLTLKPLAPIWQRQDLIDFQNLANGFCLKLEESTKSS